MGIDELIITLVTCNLTVNVMRQSAFLVFNPVTVNGYASIFNCTPVDPGVRLYDGYDLKFINFSWLELECFCLLLSQAGFNW